MKLSDQFREEITKFLISPNWMRNSWFEENDPHTDEVRLSVYLRIATHNIHGVRMKTLDIANISISAACRSQGLFTTLFEFLEGLLQDDKVNVERIQGIYVECILIDRFADKLRRMGLEEIPTIPISFWSPIPLQFGKLALAPTSTSTPRG